jgi:hypothetical protein
VLKIHEGLFLAEKNAVYQAVLGRSILYETARGTYYPWKGEVFHTMYKRSREEMYFIAMIYMAYRTFLVDKNAVHY